VESGVDSLEGKIMKKDHFRIFRDGPFRKFSCGSAHEFLEKMSPRGPIFGLFELGNWIFRGESDSRWVLVPSAFRTGASLFDGRAWRVLCKRYSTRVKTSDQLSAEFHTLRLFFNVADQQGLPLPEDGQRLRALLDQFTEIAPSGTKGKSRVDEPSWPQGELLSLMALGQHYGLPTRLIDWSWNPLVAAYFAAAGATKAICQQSQKRKQAHGPTHLRVWAVNKEELSFEGADWWSVDVDKIQVATAPAATNPNLAAQKGLFTLVRRATSAKYLLREPMDHTIQRRMVQIFGKDGGPGHALIIYFMLPVEEAPALLTLLARDGVTAAEVFPGYGGVVQALKERNLWKDYSQM
jgi:hypothetical protein